MTKYFTSVYKNYYDKISNSNIINNSSALNEKIDLLNSTINNYCDYVSSCSWSESGKNSLISSYIPNMNSKVDVVKKNSSSLNNTAGLVANELFSLLKELKSKDEEYTSIQNEVRNGVSTKKSELDNLDNQIVSLVNNIDSKILSIKNGKNDEVVASAASIDTSIKKSTDGSTGLEKLKNLIYGGSSSSNNDGIVSRLKRIKNASKSTKTTTSTTVKVEKSVKSSNVNTIDILGSKYDVIKSSISPQDYQSFAYDKGIRQNSNTERYSDLCLAFSYVHASNIYNGSYSDNAESAYNWAHASEFSDYFNDDKTETLKVVYDQVMDGKPVILQVNGNKSGTSRHFVTVVGIKDGVNKEKITEQDLLILDSWDAKLERMDESTSRFMTTGKQTNKSYSGYYLRVLK